MSRYATPCLLMILILVLTTNSILAQRGTFTPGRYLPEIMAEVETKLDLGNAYIADTAMTMAADYPGQYSINQISQIYNTMAQGGWFYYNDTTGSESYQNANRSLQRGKIKNTIGMGDCDDFAILMASLIQSIGGFSRVIFAYDYDNQKGHAYTELYLGNGTSEVNETINWLKREYQIKYLPGINRTGDEIWLNLDWGNDNTKAAYPGGPYFGEGSRNVKRDVVWPRFPNHLMPPAIVPMIDSMDSVEGWQTLNDNKGSIIKIDSIPGKKANATQISYDLKEGGWVGISKEIDPYNLSSVAGLNFSFLMMEKQNTIEMRLVYNNGTAFGVSWSNLKTKSWQSQKTLYTNLKCSSPGNKWDLERNFNISSVRSIEFIISNSPDAGDQAGQGAILLDEVRGLMAIPTGSAWERAEKEREIAAARDLAAQSEMALRDPLKNAEGLALAVESLSHSFTPEGAIRVRSGLEQIPRPIARIELNSSMFFNGVFGPDGTIYAIYFENTSIIYDLKTGKMLHRFNHSDHIFSVAFSPIERLFATASYDNTAKIWDIDSGKEIRPPLSHEDSVIHLCFSPNGKLLATASNKTIRIWDVHGHKEPLILNHDDPVNDALFSSNGEIIATTEYNNTEGWIETVRIWSIQSGLEITHIKFPRSSVRDWAFSPNGTMFAVASDDDVRIYDALNWSMTERLYHDDVNFIAFSADGDMLATFSDDLRVWKIPTYKELLHFGQHGMDKLKLIYHGMILPSARIGSQGLNNLAFNPDGRTLAILDSDTVCILDIQTGQKLAYFPGKHKVIDFAFSPDGKMLTTISNEYAVTWDLDQMGQEFKKINVTGYFDIAFDDNRTKIAAGSFNDTSSSTNLYMWEMETWQELWHKNMNYSAASLFFNINGSILMLACSDNMTRFLDVQTGDENYKINLGDYTSLKISADETKLILIDYIVNDDSILTGEIIRVLDIDAQKELFHLAINDSLIDLIFTPDSKKIILASRNNPLIIYDSKTGNELKRLNYCIYDSKTGNELKRLNYCRINDISLSSGGKTLATAGEDCTAKIWDINTGNELATVDPMIHNSSVQSVVFGPNEEIIATTCLGDNFVRIWNVDTGEELMKIPHPDYVKSIIFSKDGASIATTCFDETVRVWDVQSGDLLHSFAHNYRTEKVIFSRNGEFLATLGGDDVLRIWPISSKSLICQACSRLKCNLTSQEWRDQYCSDCSDYEYL